jgi:hypothetical protein
MHYLIAVANFNPGFGNSKLFAHSLITFAIPFKIWLNDSPLPSVLSVLGLDFSGNAVSIEIGISQPGSGVFNGFFRRKSRQ